jgi:phospholipase C
MGYYDASQLGLWQYAKEYTLADHFFHAAFGGSFLNHFWFICACTPRYEHAPKEMTIQHDANGNLTRDGIVTEDGFAVNTIYPVNQPHPPKITDLTKLLPPQEMPTIGDRLSAKGISWAWYSGGWDDAMAGNSAPLFQFHHQPFAYFKAYADGTPAKAKHLKDEKDFLADLEKGALPAVAFYKPGGDKNMHPGYTDIASGDAHVVSLLHAIEKSSAWKSSVVIITFDENGGYWDHVPPPKGDRWGPGSRVPTLIISPFARRHYIDHTVYDTTSILKLIETRFDLAPLGTRDAKAYDLTATLEFQ